MCSTLVQSTLLYVSSIMNEGGGKVILSTSCGVQNETVGFTGACLFVCLSVHKGTLKSHAHIFMNFFCMGRPAHKE